MAAPRKFPLRMVLLLAVVPIAWLILDHSEALNRLNNAASDWLFLFRGEIPAVNRTEPGSPPLKLVYVDIDAPAIAAFGERPWSRSHYAQLIEAILNFGQAKAVGLDIILSPAGMKSEMIDLDKARQGDADMAMVTKRYPNVVLAVKYSGTVLAFSDRAATFPYMLKGKTDPKNNPYPEGPTYPIIGVDPGTTVGSNTEWGRVGLVDEDDIYHPDLIPRFMPMFAETEGPEHTDNLVFGMKNFLKLPDDAIMKQPDTVAVIDPKTSQAIFLPQNQHRVFYDLALEMALLQLGLDHKNVHRTDDAIQLVDNDGKVRMNIPLAARQFVEVNWFSHWLNPALNPRVSGYDVARFLSLQDSPEDQAKFKQFFGQFKDALVLIGPVDPTLQDLAPTPFDADPQPKVGVYGNLLKTFFSGEYIHHSPAWLNILLQFALTALVGGLAVYSGHRAGLAKVGAVLLLGGYVFGVFEAFAHFTLVLPLITPVGSAFTTAFIGAIVRLIDEEKQKKRIKGMFGTYISPELVSRMVESGEEPKLGGEQLTISIFFSDVQGFSSFSEVLTPEKLVELMNEYLTAMTDILQAESGTLDKYIGDAVVAMYGAPIHVTDNALRACTAACRMQKRLGELRHKWINEGDKWPTIVHRMRTRIGLNTGQAVVGNMGSTSRFNYTMMGDDVNLGARLESGAKQFGVYTMCAEATMLASNKVEQSILFRQLNKIIVKGRSTPVDVYEVVCLRADATPDTLRCVELFEQGLACYFGQKWDEAMRLFAEAEKLEPLQPGRDDGVEHNPSELMQKACRKMKENPPPADWNGVLEMKEK